jgi:hypothetical protein
MKRAEKASKGGALRAKKMGRWLRAKSFEMGCIQEFIIT